MEYLRQSDVRSLLVFVRDCYAIRELESFQDFGPRLVAALPRLIPAAHITYNEMNPEKSESRNWVSSAELIAPRAARLWKEHMNEHPVLVHLLRTGDRRARRISDFWNQRQLRDSGLHNELYRHFGIGDALCISIPCPLPRVIGAGWHDGRCFTDRERLLAEIVRPHISQAWQNARVISRQQHRLQMLHWGIENLGAGVILCSTQGRVQFINAQARQYLAEYLHVKRQMDCRLSEELLLWVRREDLRLRKNADPPPVRSPLVFERENKRLVLRLLSQSGTNLILMEEERMLPDTGPIKTLGLTAREAEVLTWIARGKTNNEIATILQTHIGTVKKHIEHLFVKLGVETRTAAATRALASSQLDAVLNAHHWSRVSTRPE